MADVRPEDDTTTFMTNHIVESPDRFDPAVIPLFTCMACKASTFVELKILDQKNYVDFTAHKWNSFGTINEEYGNCGACKRKFSIRVFEEPEKGDNNNNNNNTTTTSTYTTTFTIVGDIIDHTEETPPTIAAKLCCMKCGKHTQKSLVVTDKNDWTNFEKNEHSCHVKVDVDYGSCSSCDRKFTRRVYQGETTTLADSARPEPSTSSTSIESKKEYLMEMIEIYLLEPMWTKNGHFAESFRGKGYKFNSHDLRVKIGDERFKLALVEDSDDDSDGDESDGDGDSGEWVCVQEIKSAGRKKRKEGH